MGLAVNVKRGTIRDMAVGGIFLLWVGYGLIWWGIQLARHTSSAAPLMYAMLGLGPSSYGLSSTSSTQNPWAIQPPGPGHPYPTVPGGVASSLPSQIVGQIA